MDLLRRMWDRITRIGRHPVDPLLGSAYRKWLDLERRLRDLESEIGSGYRERR